MNGSLNGKDHMRIEEVIGANIRQRREGRGYSQAAFGEKIGPLLGGAWKPQTVSAAEKGRRQFIAAELVVLAHVLECRVQDLIRVDPPQPVVITDHFTRDADYSAPLDDAIRDGGGPASEVLIPLLTSFSKAYRNVLTAQARASDARSDVNDVLAQLKTAEKTLAGFMPADRLTWLGDEDVEPHDGEDDAEAWDHV